MRAATKVLAFPKQQIVPLAQVERAHILRAMKLLGNDVGKVATALGLSTRHLYRKLDQYRFVGKIINASPVCRRIVGNPAQSSESVGSVLIENGQVVETRCCQLLHVLLPQLLKIACLAYTTRSEEKYCRKTVGEL